MCNTKSLEYKGYTGSVDFSEADRVYCGKVIGVDALISYDGATVAKAAKCFHDVADYDLSVCEESREEPERPCYIHVATIPPRFQRKTEVNVMDVITFNAIVEGGVIKIPE